MNKNEKMVDEITSMDEDFGKWYTDIVKKAELMSYSKVKGCIILRPYGYAIWENIKNILDKTFKQIGIENVSMPMFIPESSLNKEKNHIDGFAPEVAWVTHGGNEKLQERLCIRPTSEVLFCEHFADIVHSWRDLPKTYNQWCSVVRWEKTSRPFLRSIEFHWQEGHTVHETADEARNFTEKMLNVYADFCENELAMPVFKGQKTESEKFAGAVSTYAIEAMMHDGRALQAATSHYFGDEFSKAFDITFQNKQNKSEHAYYTTWGISTRIIGGIIMVHGDNSGLVLPPAVAPIQVVIIPIMSKKPEVLQKAQEVFDELKDEFRVKLDDSDQTPGWKFAEYEMKGVPLRLEIGPKDIENNQCVIVSRHNREKNIIKLRNLNQVISKLLVKAQTEMFNKALEYRNKMIHILKNMQEFNEFVKSGQKGFVESMWCGSPQCEEKIKNEFSFTSRCMPNEHKPIFETCIVCEKSAQKKIFWGKAY